MISGMMSGTMKMMKTTSRFYHCWRSLERRNAGFAYGCSNLKIGSRLLLQSVNRFTSDVSISEADVSKFVKNLLDAHGRGRKTEFDDTLQQFTVKTLIDERTKIYENIKNLAELVEEDKDMKKLAEEEKLSNEARLKEIDNELFSALAQSLSGDNFDEIILEITAGVGGQEAMLFVKNLLEMYIKHLSYLGYSYDIIEMDESPQGGCRHASIMISGKESFEKLRHEAGVHRVQRVPATEKSGRIHTSVVSVGVLPQPNDIQVEIHAKDLRIDTMRASGAGGQHVNTTNSAVRVTHLPTGMSVECQTDRSQIRNRELAMAKLRAKMYEQKLARQLRSASEMRKQQMGMGERHEKIRTYNFNQDRVTDHRLSNGTLHNLKGFLEGGMALDGLHERLSKDMQHKLLMEVLDSVKR
ncbi:peptide chain release factor 1-like, mitochondrial isoform X2 [Nasonia vitripennis]|uniref:Prokaryotic-type class I peptide chain release factors domain-containing protein n=1 Tax=Nasonia vitripennis TaxID=7425 RepID=A0A7M7G7W9_NASVI|nr:peptide chain release factor 1-like, mitochondrial isoform X2 [Nasonia vitripennis]